MKRRLLAAVVSMIMMVTCLIVPVIPSAEAAGSIYWPVPGHTTLTGTYSSDHPAIDISDGSITGAAVIAAMGGTIYKIYLCEEQHYGSNHDCNGFGTGIVIKGDDGRFYQYAHMQAGSIPSYVYYGGYVSAGAMVGRVGTTGNSSGPHLHFGISNGTSWYPCNVDPQTESYIYTTAEVSMNWTEVSATPTQTDARVSVKAVPSSSGSFGETGVVIYNANGSMIGGKTETADSTARTYLNIWYDITAETGLVLASGHTYSYQFYTYFNGVRYDSPLYSFTTTGDAAHSYGAWTVKTAATCTAEGQEVRTCSICGAVETRSIAAVGHSFGAWTTTEAATCTEAGQQRRDCTRCDYYETKTIEATGHSYEAVVTPPTCGENGYTTHTCTVCGDSYVDTYTNATGAHVYTDDEDTTCNVCGHVRELPRQDAVAVYRLYNPYTQEHLLTSEAEKDLLLAAGWSLDGLAWKAPTSGIPVYRLYNPYGDFHFYSTSQEEIASLTPLGWIVDGVVSYSATAENGKPVCRLFNPYAETNYHLFTASIEERDWLVSLGWHLEGIAWYAL